MSFHEPEVITLAVCLLVVMIYDRVYRRPRHIPFLLYLPLRLPVPPVLKKKELKLFHHEFYSKLSSYVHFDMVRAMCGTCFKPSSVDVR